MQTTRNKEITGVKGGFRQEQPKAEGIIKKTRNPRPYGVFKKMDDDELVRTARDICEKEKITSIKQFAHTHETLYRELKSRGLMESVLAPMRRNWKGMPDKKLIHLSRRYFIQHKIHNRGQLHAIDGGLENVLRDRNLLEKVLSLERLQWHKWRNMPKKRLLKAARKLCKEKCITSRNELHNKYSGLYQVLRRRKLLDSVISSRIINWKDMSYDALLDMAVKFCQENGIKSKGDLQKAYLKLYRAARSRGILDELFPKQEPNVSSLISAIEQYGVNDAEKKE